MTLPQFPALPGLGFPKRTPLWSTTKQPSVGGQESRFPMWSYPKWRYEYAIESLRQAASLSLTEFSALAGFYNSVNGSAGFFAFTDPDDGSVVGEPFGTGDGTTTTFQLTRSLGGFVEPVFLPGQYACIIYENGTPVSHGSGAGKWQWGGGVDVSTGSLGSVVFGTAPSAAVALTWTGPFDWLCRFDDDSIDFSGFGKGFWSMSSLKFTTEKL
jgi:hypothetical protein